MAPIRCTHSILIRKKLAKGLAPRPRWLLRLPRLFGGLELGLGCLETQNGFLALKKQRIPKNPASHR